MDRYQRWEQQLKEEAKEKHLEETMDEERLNKKEEDDKDINRGN